MRGIRGRENHSLRDGGWNRAGQSEGAGYAAELPASSTVQYSTV